MNIIAITIGSYPIGEATTNRNISILKGLTELGNNVELLVLSPTNKIISGNRKPSGIVNGVRFQYTSRTVEWNQNILYKISIMLRSIYKALKIISIRNKTLKIDALILLLSEPLLMHPFISLSRRNNIKVFHEQTEAPEIVFPISGLISKLRLAYYKFLMKRLDGIYVITSYLKNYFSSFIDESKICIINMTVDHTRFNTNMKSPFKFKYIAYCGTMYSNKDGLIDLISAFSYIANKTNLKLVLIGDLLDNRSKYVIDLVNEMKLNNQIILTGSIENTYIPKYLMNAEMLVLARPDNIQAKGGFPTKLGEYLLTLKPSIVTEVGDIPNFLSDCVNAFIVKPGNPFLFAQKILYVIDNYEFALEVAKTGRDVAQKYFNYVTESKKLQLFLRNFIK